MVPQVGSSVSETEIRWKEAGREECAVFLSGSRAAPPARVLVADDSMRADVAHRLTCEGTALLWRGDFENAKQLLNAVGRRLDRRTRRRREPLSGPAAFHRYRMESAQRARVLGMLLVELGPDYAVSLRRAPNLTEAMNAAFGSSEARVLAPLREILGAMGAHEWRKRGVWVPALGARVYPHYGVFAPIRGEYVRLVEKAPLRARDLAFDVGTGSGVLAALLAKRGVSRVIATDDDPRAVECASENIERLGLDDRVEVIRANLFPAAEVAPRASLVVCNPPWIPAKATTSLERAVYDPKSRMLRGFLRALPARLETGGEAWLLMSDLAEHLGLRAPRELEDTFAEAGLEVIERLDVRPEHPRARDEGDPLHEARKAERTSLWRLAVASRDRENAAGMP